MDIKEQIRPALEAACDILGEGINTLVKLMGEIVGDEERVQRYFKALGADEMCFDLPDVEPMGLEELKEFHPKAAYAFFKALYELVGEKGVYAFCKAMARILLRKYGDRALEELERRISFGEHRVNVKVRAKDDKINVLLILNREKIPKEEVLKLGKHGTIFTNIAALLLAYPKDVKRLETKPVDDGILYVYEVIQRSFYSWASRSQIEMMIGTRV